MISAVLVVARLFLQMKRPVRYVVGPGNDRNLRRLFVRVLVLVSRSWAYSQDIHRKWGVKKGLGYATFNLLRSQQSLLTSPSVWESAANGAGIVDYP